MNEQCTDILMEILKVSTEKNFAFTYQKGVKKNYLEIRGNEVILNIHYTDDPNLFNFLNEKLKELNSIAPY